MDLKDLYDRKIEVSTNLATKLSIEDLSIVVSEFRKYVRYRYKISSSTTFSSEKGIITCKFWADSAYRKEQQIDPRIYQDNFIGASNFLIADFEEIVAALEADDDVISSQGKDIRKPTIKKAMRKYIPELKVLDARKARKKARKVRQELARIKKAAQQNTQPND